MHNLGITEKHLTVWGWSVSQNRDPSIQGSREWKTVFPFSSISRNPLFSEVLLPFNLPRVFVFLSLLSINSSEASRK